MATNIVGVTQTQPTSQVDIVAGGSFTQGGQIQTSGSGGWAESGDMYFEWDQGLGDSDENYATLGSTGDLNIAAQTNPLLGLQDANEHTITVYGDVAGEYYVRVKLIEDDLTEHVTAGVAVVVSATVDVYDSSSVTDVPTVDIQAAPEPPVEINIFDSPSLTEDVTALTGPLGGVDVFDSPSVSEDVTSAGGALPTDVYDSPSVAEDVTVNIAEVATDININVNNTCSLAEYIFLNSPIETRVTQAFVEVLESGQSANVLVTQGFVEVLESGQSANIRVTQGFVEVLTWGPFRAKDTVGIVEDVTVSVFEAPGVTTININDTPSIAEDITVELGTETLTPSVYDDPGIAEGITAITGSLPVDTYDETGAAEDITVSTTVAGAVNISIYDEITLTESIEAKGGALQATTFDLLSIEENVSTSGGSQNVSIFDICSVEESVAGSWDLPVEVNDTAGVAEDTTLAIVAFPLGISVYTTSNITESVSSISGTLSVSLSEELAALTEFIGGKGGDLCPNVSDNCSVAEAVELTAGLQIVVYDALGVIESSLATTSDLKASSVESVGVVESISIGLSVLSISVNDGVSVSEDVETSSRTDISIYDAVSCIEAISGKVEVGVVVTDEVVTSELVTGIVSSLSIASTEDISIDELVDEYWEIVKGFIDFRSAGYILEIEAETEVIIILCDSEYRYFEWQ